MHWLRTLLGIELDDPDRAPIPVERQSANLRAALAAAQAERSARYIHFLAMVRRQVSRWLGH